MNRFLDIMLTFIHLMIIAFNLFGWIWVRARKVHLFVIALTAGSWFLLGIRYGLGYCFLTDWHWKVKLKLGETNLPASFIKYMADKITGMHFHPRTVDTFTLVFFLATIAITVYVNFLRENK